MAKIAADVPGFEAIYMLYIPHVTYINMIYMRTNELPSLACLLYISFALLSVSVFGRPRCVLASSSRRWSCRAARLCHIKFRRYIPRRCVCLIPFKSHTHTGTLAHPLWPGTPCGKAWGASGTLSSFTLSIAFAWPRLVARRFFLSPTGFSFGLENSLSKDFHQHVIAETWEKFATAAECMLVQVCASLCKSLTHSVCHK